jgi:hypothetical protein
LAALAAVCAALAGCGGGAIAPDLFEVIRSGAIPGAQLDLVVSNDGFARCNRGPRQMIAGSELLDARSLQQELDSDARLGRKLAPGPNAVLGYRVRMMDGTIVFADTSPGISLAMRKLAALTHELATRVCGLAV